jgi:predicted MarR family transcription regulator
MRPSIKRPSVIIPRPTKASLARQSKIRNSILVSSTTTTTNSLNTLKPIQNEQIKSENDLTTIGLNKQQIQVRRTSTIAKNNIIFKRRRSLHKLAVIVSSSSLDNSTGDGETLKQVVSFRISS